MYREVQLEEEFQFFIRREEELNLCRLLTFSTFTLSSIWRTNSVVISPRNLRTCKTNICNVFLIVHKVEKTLNVITYETHSIDHINRMITLIRGFLVVLFRKRDFWYLITISSWYRSHWAAPNLIKKKALEQKCVKKSRKTRWKQAEEFTLKRKQQELAVESLRIPHLRCKSLPASSARRDDRDCCLEIRLRPSRSRDRSPSTGRRTAFPRLRGSNRNECNVPSCCHAISPTF